jgi:hypothetical protein
MPEDPDMEDVIEGITIQMTYRHIGGQNYS